MVDKNIKIEIPQPVREILEALQEHGYEAYIVGGCVRDMLIGREPMDWDITTSAMPQEVKQIFHNTVDTGIQHGTVMVIKNAVGYEVTTYRVDGEYKDGRHPQSVTFTRSLEEDLKRRDFTINAFAWGEDGLIDMFDGVKDLKDGIIRCVGDPEERFNEDALRIMRAVRFSAQLGFAIEPRTKAMISKYAGRLADISMERIREEWEKTLMSPNPAFVNEYAELGLARFIVRCQADDAGDAAGRCFDSSKDGLMTQIIRRDRLKSALSVELVQRYSEPQELKRRLMMAAFFDNLSYEEANAALRYLKYDNKTREAVVNIIRYKNEIIPADKVAIKQILNKIGLDTFIAVLEFRHVAESAINDDAESGINSSNEEHRSEINDGVESETDGSNYIYQNHDSEIIAGEETQCQTVDPTYYDLELIAWITQELLRKNEPWSLSQLAINGSDLIAAGMPAGKKIGEILEKLLQKVILSPTLNNKEMLLEEANYGCEKGI